MTKDQVSEVNQAFSAFESALAGTTLKVSEAAAVLRALDVLRTALQKNVTVTESSSTAQAN